MNEVLTLSALVGERLKAKKYTLTLAESCTGGGIACAITEIAGSSAWFERSFVTYSNQAKTQMLGVSEKALQDHGAVSEEVAKQMAVGALKAARANFAISVSGIAGPDGGSEEKPVGTVCFAFASKEAVIAKTMLFKGDRFAVRKQSIVYALQELLAFLADDR